MLGCSEPAAKVLHINAYLPELTSTILYQQEDGQSAHTIYSFSRDYLLDSSSSDESFHAFFSNGLLSIFTATR